MIPSLVLASSPAACVAAPSVTIAGAYFPAWLLCALVGVAGSLVARSTMVTTGHAHSLPLQLLACTAIGTLCGLVAWLLWTGA